MAKKIMWWHNNNEDKPASPFVAESNRHKFDSEKKEVQSKE